ncbi:hypothetical protein [Nocardia sp. NBC_01327]|uniref:hypothetical protein n=1 Tax=Nocardia sp. NBC_01327 TaxID=2903593 RepID=UPI002E10B9BA|nr:hypothetical protein OG326_23905 [Nocardia sp. NBC_01327]
MPVLETATLSAATFLGGTGLSSFFMWLRARQRAPVEQMQGQIAVAKGINDMALATLQKVGVELGEVTARLDRVEAAQEKTLTELHRVDGLFREALSVLRMVIEAVQAERLPKLTMSDDLLREIAKVARQ